MKYNDIPQFTRDSSYKIDVTWDYLEGTLENWGSLARSPLILDPDFQRGHVWTEAQQIAYVEFCMRGGRSGRDIYFNCSTWQGKYNTPVYLVDGKQRLTAVRRFMANEIRVFGHYHNQFEGKMPFDRCSFKFNVNTLPKYSDMLRWYLEMNTGGVVHTEEEINKVRKMLEETKEA